MAWILQDFGLTGKAANIAMTSEGETRNILMEILETSPLFMKLKEKRE